MKENKLNTAPSEPHTIVYPPLEVKRTDMLDQLYEQSLSQDTETLADRLYEFYCGLSDQELKSYYNRQPEVKGKFAMPV